MHLAPAPLFTDIHPGPDDGVAYWLRAADGLRVRMGVWPAKGAKGTVLLFPGRSEYVEKYGPAAALLAERGLATVTIDWRGQGLADRMLDEPRIGHVERFTDYQMDVATMVEAAKALDLPRPWYLLAHSMGGCIGLRALMEGLDVEASAFTGPMWGIRIAPHMRPPAWVLGYLMPALGQGHRLPPSTRVEPYVIWSPFEDNMLTTDRVMFDMMRDQLKAHPELELGGPSFVWLREALSETTHLLKRPSPDVPSIVFMGSNERVVHIQRMQERVERWSNSRLEIVEGAEHEVLMEGPGTTVRLFDTIAAHFYGSSRE